MSVDLIGNNNQVELECDITYILNIAKLKYFIERHDCSDDLQKV